MNINMEHKNIVATIYLKDGKAIKARDNYEEYPDVIELANSIMTVALIKS